MSSRHKNLSLNHPPWYPRPQYFDVMAFPTEWLCEGYLDDSHMREILATYYVRAWGKHRVTCLPTLYYKRRLDEWFADDLAMGLRELSQSDPTVRMCASETLRNVLDGRLKSMGYTIEVDDYNVLPLFPSGEDIPKMYKMALGTPYPPEQAIELMRSIISKPKALGPNDGDGVVDGEEAAEG